jgi:hypothetical protein
MAGTVGLVFADGMGRHDGGVGGGLRTWELSGVTREKMTEYPSTAPVATGRREPRRCQFVVPGLYSLTLAIEPLTSEPKLVTAPGSAKGKGENHSQTRCRPGVHSVELQSCCARVVKHPRGIPLLCQSRTVLREARHHDVGAMVGYQGETKPSRGMEGGP